jgi:tetratricopeptide (TPR) repeat protein
MMDHPWIRRALWLTLAVLAALPYLPALDGPFVYDDKVEVVGNLAIRSFDDWRAVARYNVGRTLLIFTYAFDLQQHGFVPRGYHLTNLLLQGLSVGAAWFAAEAVLRRFAVGQAAPRALLVTAIWAFHPMLSESVAYITGRSEVLCGLFSFLAVGAWARALNAEAEGRSGVGLRLGGVGAMVAAALSKEPGAVLPFVFLALEAAGPRGARAVRWPWFAAFALALGAAAYARVSAFGALFPREAERTLAVQLTTSAAVWLRTLGLWAFPGGQTLFHAQADLSPASLPGAAALGGWAALVAAAVALGRRHPPAGFALAAAALLFAPSTSFVQLKEHMAEHRSYQAGFYLLLAAGALLPFGRPARVGAGALALAATLAALTVQRAQIWSSEVALWAEATRRSPAAADAWYGLGDAHRFAGQLSEAIGAYAEATARDPAHVDAWNNLGIAAAELGDAPRARAAWAEALRIRPSSCKVHNNLGSFAVRNKDWDGAVAELTSTLAYCPEDPIAHYLLGNIYFGPLRDPRRAQRHYEAVVAVAPRFDHIDLVKQRLLELTW